MADGRESEPLVWVVMLLLRTLHVTLLCVSVLIACGRVLVFGAEPGAVRSVFLCDAAYRFGIWQCQQQILAVVEACGSAGIANGDVGVEPVDSHIAMGGSCPWQTDGYLLFYYFLRNSCFGCAKDRN